MSAAACRAPRAAESAAVMGPAEGGVVETAAVEAAAAASSGAAPVDCLFGDASFPSAAAALAHMREVHKLDLHQLLADWKLDIPNAAAAVAGDGGRASALCYCLRQQLRHLSPAAAAAATAEPSERGWRAASWAEADELRLLRSDGSWITSLSRAGDSRECSGGLRQTLPWDSTAHRRHREPLLLGVLAQGAALAISSAADDNDNGSGGGDGASSDDADTGGRGSGGSSCGGGGGVSSTPARRAAGGLAACCSRPASPQVQSGRYYITGCDGADGSDAGSSLNGATGPNVRAKPRRNSVSSRPRDRSRQGEQERFRLAIAERLAAASGLWVTGECCARVAGLVWRRLQSVLRSTRVGDEFMVTGAAKQGWLAVSWPVNGTSKAAAAAPGRAGPPTAATAAAAAGQNPTMCSGWLPGGQLWPEKLVHGRPMVS